MPQPGPPMNAHTPPPMPPREMRARLFWLARWLFGGSSYHRGPIEVAVAKGKGRDKLTLIPEPGDEVYDADAGPAAAERLADLVPRLLATFVSSDSLAILKAVADRGPVAAKAIASSSTIERTRCYELLRELRERGLIRDTGDGYELAAPEVWGELLRGG